MNVHLKKNEGQEGKTGPVRDGYQWEGRLNAE
jgi:hypothetical protein